MKVERVGSKADLREFLDLPLRLHPRDLYVPLLDHVVERHAQTAELLLVRDSAGTVVGRTSVHRDAGFDAKVGPRQLFGHTEFINDDNVFSALVDALQARAGGRALFGPVALLPNQTGGVITSGFEERGFVDSAWNPAHYPAAYERHGFTRRFESDTWWVDIAGSDQAFCFDDRRISEEKLVVRHGSRRHLPEQLEILRPMLNASFSSLGYYTPISAADLAAQTEGLAFLLDEGLLLWLEKAGRPVAFVITVPDLSDYFMKTGGRMRLLDQLRLLATRRRYRRDAVLIIKGTVPDEQGNGYLTLLSRELHRNLVAGGYRTLRSTFVERDNAASAAQYQRAGGRPLHGCTFYERPA